jgi:hypothetical protein
MGSTNRSAGIESRDIVEAVAWLIVIAVIVYGLWRAYTVAVQAWYPQVWTLPV